ncbi:MAG: amidohydrolase [Phycisphaerae bacterium]|nr:amidohydrolase [Phycisphaerae bacterium]
MSDAITPIVDEILPEVVRLRQDLHAHPELSFQERSTAGKVRAILRELPGVEVSPPIMETDVVAVLDTGRPGRCMGIRADLDALPLDEEASLEEVAYRSTVPGVMHACGHDGHTATLVGTAMVLSRLAPQMSGKVKFIFQPGEEEGGGAKTLCAEGVMTNPQVDAIIALHAWPVRSVGTVSLRYGPALASNDPFFVTIRGHGSHGAYPQKGIDPIVASAHIVTALQTVVARNVAPIDAAVVTIGAINAGATTNIIPAECRMQGTLRHLRPEVGELLRRRVREIIEWTARAHGATADLRFEEGYPPVVNDDTMCRLVEEAARDMLGPEGIATDEPPSLGVEDFSYYGQRTPSVMFRLGVRPRHMEDYPPLHNPRFNFNDDALSVGIRVFCEVTRRFLAGA